MNTDDLKEELATLAQQVRLTDAATRLAGVDHKVKTANRSRAIGVAAAVGAAVVAASFTAPQLLATPESSNRPAGHPAPSTDTTPPATSESTWTPVGRQEFSDKPDHVPPAIDIRSVDVLNSRNALVVSVHAANLEPGRAAVSMYVTDSTKPFYTHRGTYRVIAYQEPNGAMHAGLYSTFSGPEDGKAPMRCPDFSVVEVTDVRSRIDVTIPKACTGDMEGPLRLWVELLQPGTEGGMSDQVYPQPMRVR